LSSKAFEIKTFDWDRVKILLSIRNNLGIGKGLSNVENRFDCINAVGNEFNIFFLHLSQDVPNCRN